MELLREIAALWANKIELAVDYKRRVYDPIVNLLMRYYSTRYFHLADNGEFLQSPFMLPVKYHQVSIALVGQFVRVMLPYIHYRVPTRVVRPRQDLVRLWSAFYSPEVVSRMVESHAGEIKSLLGTFMLNYAADDATNNLREEVRKATQEALVCGRGVVWHETTPTPYGDFPGSFYVPQRHLVIDPDCDEVRDAGFVARFRERPRWAVAEEFEIPIEELPASATSYDSLARIAVTHGSSAHPKKDTCQYWEVYSRIGLGHRVTEDSGLRERLEAVSSMVGDNVYLAIMPGAEYPLNLYPKRIENATEAEILNRVAWPIPTFGDANDPWPFTVLDFYKQGIYPKPPLEDALPLQTFLDYAYTFLMMRIRHTSRSILLTPESINEELENALKFGFDCTIVKLRERFPDTANLVHELQFRPVNRDVWDIISAIKREWEDSTGLTQLLRGGEADKMMRSSAEAQIRQANSQIRPDDLRDCVTAFHSAIARKELIAQRTLLKAPQVGYFFGERSDTPILGPITMAWKQFMQVDVVTEQDAWAAAQELTVTVEGSSGRRKTKEKQVADVQDAMQMVLPILAQERARTGDPTQLNAFLRLWADAMEIENPEQFMLKPLQPPGQQMEATAASPMAQQQEPIPEPVAQEPVAPENGGMMTPSEEAVMEQTEIPEDDGIRQWEE